MSTAIRSVPLREACQVDKLQGHYVSLPYIGLEDIESETGRFLGSNEPTEVKSTTFRFSDQHVLYGRLRPYLNKVLLPNFEGHCSTEIFPLRPKKTLMREFLAYWLMSDSTVSNINATSTGARMPRANMNEVLDFPIPLPAVPEQQRIVATLDEAFEGIAKAKENTEKNVANARAIFDSALNAVFTTKEDGWTEKTLEEVCFKITDGTHQTPQYFSSGVIFLSSRNVTSRKIDWDNVKYIDEIQHREMHKRVAPRRNDILLAKNGTTGVAAIVDKDLTFDIYVSLAWLRTKEGLEPRYLLNFLNSPVAKRQFNKRLKGIGVPNLHLNEIREVIINIPNTKNEQLGIIQRIDQIDNEIDKLKNVYDRKKREIENLKKSLLHHAFTGQL